MLKIIFLSSLVIFIANVSNAQIKPPVIQPTGAESVYSQPEDRLGRELAASGKNYNSLLVWGGMNNYLYTYTDKRYIGSDQGDYIKSDSYNGGIEMVISNFADYDPALSDLRVGFNFNTLYVGRIKSRYLYAVATPTIPEEWVPDLNDSKTKIWKFRVLPGMFLGVDKKWWAADLGFTLNVGTYGEYTREKRAPNPADPNIIVKKKGVFFGQPQFAMNFYFRLGREDKGYFDLGFYRQDYNPEYGTMQYRIVMPVTDMFALKIGGFFYPTSGFFVEPVLKLTNLELALKAGAIINYYDDHLKVISVTDTLFYNISIAYKW